MEERNRENVGPLRLPPPRQQIRIQRVDGLSTSQIYCILSVIVAILAIVTSSLDRTTTVRKTNNLEKCTLGMMEMKTCPIEDVDKKNIETEVYGIIWRSGVILSRVLDPSILSLGSGGWTEILDKITQSSPRLLAMANLVLSVTYLVHSAVADRFLGSSESEYPPQHGRIARERIGGFLLFKLLLVSAVVEPDTLDLLILLSWYTCLGFLRSLAQLSASTIAHTSHSGLAPHRGVLHLLILLLICNFSAASFCVALFHSAGIGMVLLLTCDCALLLFDILVNLARHLYHTMDHRHSEALAFLEQQSQNQEELFHMQLENHNNGLLNILDTFIFVLEITSSMITFCHFLHIWSLHGFTFGLVDGVLALHLHTALSTLMKKISERRNLLKIARDLDLFFQEATEKELRFSYMQGDVCCICLRTMIKSKSSNGSVKKLPCGHLYHAHCLREVVERARSVHSAKCPLCRANVIDGSPLQQQQHQRQVPPQQQEVPLFRFSTDNIIPTWLPIPAFSFEIVRRPTAIPETLLLPTDTTNNTPPAVLQQQQPHTSFWRRFLFYIGLLPMSAEEQAQAVNQLVDMFPQYSRHDLLRELQERGSAQNVVESIFLGRFQGLPVRPIDEVDIANNNQRDNQDNILQQHNQNIPQLPRQE